ncbi:TetR/AcrR family transcriptional regulator [Fictibacillus aquaticus]|uniref:TetR family transcriptional regulator n=1 Tax=Fictibacillus aquaticus TaxID=2021314 RepID=A0A235FD67_9BACL|nr:TetR/AcrR family transcriptional regulator [Fictibacillus aquaticus]OYD59276.1 TetR family transcriptional regulator [Fictibacillus aquaticus]
MPENDWIQELLSSDKGALSDKQVKILEAATEIFAERGYAATSTNEIARRAGVAEGTIFRHYKTKKDLLLSIVTPTMIKFVAPHFAKSFAKDVFNEDYVSYTDFVRKLAFNRFDFAKKNQQILKIFLQEIAFHEELRTPFKAIFTEHILNKFKAVVEKFQQNGEIVSMPPESVMRLTVTNVIGLVLARFLFLPEADWDDEAELERTVDFIVKGLSK